MSGLVYSNISGPEGNLPVDNSSRPLSATCDGGRCRVFSTIRPADKPVSHGHGNRRDDRLHAATPIRERENPLPEMRNIV